MSEEVEGEEVEVEVEMEEVEVKMEEGRSGGKE